MADAGATHGLEEHEAADHVGARVSDGVRDAVAQVDLGGVMGDEVDLLLAQERLQIHLRDVGLNEPGFLGEPLAAARGQIVHDDDAVPVRQVSFRHVRADEARASGHEDVHRILSMSRVAA